MAKPLDEEDPEVRAAMVPLVRLMHKRGLTGVNLERAGTICHITAWAEVERRNRLEFRGKMDGTSDGV